MGGACSTYGKDKKCIQNLCRKPERKKPVGYSWRRWEDNIRMDLTEIGWEVVDWINLAQDREP
jgi:hypothetical protein